MAKIIDLIKTKKPLEIKELVSEKINDILSDRLVDIIKEVTVENFDFNKQKD